MRFRQTLCGLALLGAGAGLLGQVGGLGTYYASAEGLAGDELDLALHAIIDSHIVHADSTVREVIPLLDADPEAPGNIILIYSGRSMSASLFGEGSTRWNQEHLWPQSFGADAGPENSDFHHLFPVNGAVNAFRSNFAYAEFEGGVADPAAPESFRDAGTRRFEPRDEDKGRVARAMFYMATRYDGSEPDSEDFTLAQRIDQLNEVFGELNDLLDWNRRFPPDDYEIRRNELIFSGVEVGNVTVAQRNRNPFIDFPALADAIYTSDIYVTHGSWQIEHFTFHELLDPQVSDDGADPDADGLPNLLEMAGNFDPQAETTAADDRPAVDRRDNGQVVLSFTRVALPERSGIRFLLEHSTYPFRADSWEVYAFDDLDVAETPLGRTLRVEVSDRNLPATVRPRQVRLRVERDYPVNDPTFLVYDPIAEANPDGSIFAYAPLVSADGWRQDPDFGFVADDAFPWVFHFGHDWIFSLTPNRDFWWFYDQRLGSLFTQQDLYPYVYDPENGWLFYQEGSVTPERWFYRLSDARWLQEADL